MGKGFRARGVRKLVAAAQLIVVIAVFAVFAGVAGAGTAADDEYGVQTTPKPATATVKQDPKTAGLPFTGMSLVGTAAAGAGLVALGVFLRRRDGKS
jgi:hypothetical protein